MRPAATCDEFCDCPRCIVTRVQRREADRRQADIAVAEERRVSSRRRSDAMAMDELIVALAS